MQHIGFCVPQTIEIDKLFTSFEETFDKNYSFEGETHDFWELVFVLDGDLGVCAGSRVLSLTRGDAILHEPLEFHRLWSEHQTTPRVFIVSFSTRIMPYCGERVFSIPTQELEYVNSMYELCAATYKFEGFAVRGVRAGHELGAGLFVKELEGYIVKMLSCYCKTTLELEQNRSKSALAYIDIVHFLESNMEKSLSIDEIAQGCNMSRSNLKKTFSKYSGVGIMKYLTMLKVRRAEEYLRQGLAVKDISSRLGFCDANYFSTVFKKCNGRTPSEYVDELEGREKL